MLDQVKMALRIKTNAYDTELGRSVFQRTTTD